MEGSVLVTDCPPMVAVMTRAEPDVVPLKMEMYLPLLLSKTALNVPADVPVPNPNATVSPPPVNLLPLASLAINVTSVVSPEEINERPTDTVD